jgi:hypothetical protein
MFIYEFKTADKVKHKEILSKVNLVYVLLTWNMVFRKLQPLYVIEKLTTIIRKLRFYLRAQKNTILDNIHSQINLVRTLTSYLCEFHFNVILHI